MAYKLTGNQTERVLDNLRFLEDTMKQLERNSELKEAEAAKREKELMESIPNDDLDKEGLRERNKYLEMMTHNLQ